MSTQHGVRCCTEDASVGWPFKCTGGITGVYGESNVPSCYLSSTFNDAVTICSTYSGGRLCSGTELLNYCTRGTGCSLNKQLVWGCTEVSDTCASDAECCTGVCSGGVCDDPVPPPAPTNPPTKDPTLAVSISGILLCIYLSLALCNVPMMLNSSHILSYTFVMHKMLHTQNTIHCVAFYKEPH